MKQELVEMYNSAFAGVEKNPVKAISFIIALSKRWNSFTEDQKAQFKDFEQAVNILKALGYTISGLYTQKCCITSPNAPK